MDKILKQKYELLILPQNWIDLRGCILKKPQACFDSQFSFRDSGNQITLGTNYKHQHFGEIATNFLNSSFDWMYRQLFGWKLYWRVQIGEWRSSLLLYLKSYSWYSRLSDCDCHKNIRIVVTSEKKHFRDVFTKKLKIFQQKVSPLRNNR